MIEITILLIHGLIGKRENCFFDMVHAKLFLVLIFFFHLIIHRMKRTKNDMCCSEGRIRP